MCVWRSEGIFLFCWNIFSPWIGWTHPSLLLYIISMQHARQPVNDFTLFSLLLLLLLSLLHSLSSPSPKSAFQVERNEKEPRGMKKKRFLPLLFSHISPLAGYFCKRRGSPPAVVAAAAAVSYLPSRPRRA